MTTAQDTGQIAPATERLHLIDTLRALALYGVITFNMIAMVVALVGAELFSRAGPLDTALASVDLILIQGKARAAFALLFGVGFGILMTRAAAKGQDFTRFYLRRMAVLLAIGLGNLALLFWGDILILYALLGMVMLLFRRWSDRAVLRVGIALVVLPPLLAGLAEAMLGKPLPNWAGLSEAQAGALLPASAPIYRGADFLAYVRANLAYYVDHYRADTSYAAVYALGVFGLFLLGLWVARSGVFAAPERWRVLLRRVVQIGIPLGLALSVLHATRRMGIETDGALYAAVTAAYVGLPILAFGYLAALTLWLSRGGGWLQRALSPMGRMALTGYLASNAIGSFVWYGWGLGLIGRFNIAAINLFALLLYLGLCLFSAAWLARFRFGPAEWLWRSLSYGRVQPLRR